MESSPEREADTRASLSLPLLLVVLALAVLAPLIVFSIFSLNQFGNTLRGIDEEMAELAVADREHTITGRERVHDCRFPHRGARCRKDKRLGLRGSVDLRQVAEDAFGQRGKRGGPVVFLRAVHRAQPAAQPQDSQASTGA